MKYTSLFSPVLAGLLLVGAVLLLVFLGAVMVGWFDRPMYLLYLRTILLVLAGLLVLIDLLSFIPRVIQWNKDRMPTSSEQPVSSSMPPPQNGETASLSKEEARKWLDDFLVEQQKPGLSSKD